MKENTKVKDFILNKIKEKSKELKNTNSEDLKSVDQIINELMRLNNIINNDDFLNRLSPLYLEKKDLERKISLSQNRMFDDFLIGFFWSDKRVIMDLNDFINEPKHEEKEKILKTTILKKLKEIKDDKKIEKLEKIKEELFNLPLEINLVDFFKELEGEFSAFKTIDEKLLRNKKIKKFTVSERIIAELISYVDSSIQEVKKEISEDEKIMDDLKNNKEKVSIINKKIEEALNEFNTLISF